jgi:hypothetical protein
MQDLQGSFFHAESSYIISRLLFKTIAVTRDVVHWLNRQPNAK